MAMFLRAFLSVLTVACVHAVRSDGHVHLDSGAGPEQDMQGNQGTEIREHMSQEAGSQEEEGKKACCRCKSHGQQKFVDNSGKCTPACPIFQYGDCP